MAATATETSPDDPEALGERRFEAVDAGVIHRAASMGDLWQPIEVGMAGMTRAAETCADLETVDAQRGCSER
ncbi:MAG: hypothetical protein OEY23_06840 [Acidimicrobiia bacterium]|nr:hypothetical protein [Acidimicrobiia bacterium]